MSEIDVLAAEIRALRADVRELRRAVLGQKRGDWLAELVAAILRTLGDHPFGAGDGYALLAESPHAHLLHGVTVQRFGMLLARASRQPPPGAVRLVRLVRTSAGWLYRLEPQ